MKPYLSRSERKNLVARFEYMVGHIRQLIEARGEETVLFDLAAGAIDTSWVEENESAAVEAGDG